MSKEDLIELDGTVVEVLAGSWFKVAIQNNKNHIVMAYLGGKIRMNKIKILLGDNVVVAVSQYDPSKGKIIYRK